MRKIQYTNSKNRSIYEKHTQEISKIPKYLEVDNIKSTLITILITDKKGMELIEQIIRPV